jgi:hypothetical protein
MASVLLSAVSLAHLLRLLFGIPVTVADWLVPMWVSAIAAVVAGSMALLLWRSGRRQ